MNLLCALDDRPGLLTSRVVTADPDYNDNSNDQALIAAINNRNEKAFGILFYRYRDWVAGTAYRFSHDHFLALDVLQETFLYFLTKVPGFVLTSQFKSFLYPPIKHLSWRLKQKAGETLSTEGEQESIERMPSFDPEPFACEEMLSLLAGLSRDHQETLQLRFVDGFTLAEISRTMKVSQGTVKSRLHYALRNLRSKTSQRHLNSQPWITRN